MRNSLVDSNRDWYEAQVLAGCIKSKAFHEMLLPVICVDPQKPGKTIDDFSYPVDNVIYRIISMYRSSTVGIAGTDLVPIQFIQVTAQAMTLTGDLLPEQVAMVGDRIANLMVQPVEGLLPDIESSTGYWLSKSRAQKIAMPAANPTGAPENLVREKVSQSEDKGRPTEAGNYRYKLGDGRRSSSQSTHPGKRCMQSGIPPFDAMTGGFGYGEFALGIAPTGAGKTMMACQLAASFALDGYAGILVTTHESELDLRRRLVASRCNINIVQLNHGYGQLSPDQRTAAETQQQQLEKLVRIVEWKGFREKIIEKHLHDEIRQIRKDGMETLCWVIFDEIAGGIDSTISTDRYALGRRYHQAAAKLAEIAKNESLVVVAFANANPTLAKDNERIDSQCAAECKTMNGKATTTFGISGIGADQSAFSARQFLFVSRARKQTGQIPITRRSEYQRFEPREEEPGSTRR